MSPINQALCGLARPSEVTIAHLEESEERSARARVATIPRYACGSRDGVIAAVRGGAPAVVSGAMADWEGLRLQPTYLRRELGDILLRSAAGALPLRDFLQVMFEDDAPIYTWGADLPADLRPLDPPADLATLPPQIWMGSANIRHGALDPSTSLHRDLATSLLCQIFGHKLIILYSPDQSPCLYPSRNFAFHQPCFAEPLGCDEKRFPRLREARPLLTLLMPGEILVIPRHWFHTVYAMSPTLSVSYLVADDGPFTRALAEVFRATGARDYGELLPALHDNIPAELWIEREGPTMVRAAGGR